jgi:thiosulfate dehydrogenase
MSSDKKDNALAEALDKLLSLVLFLITVIFVLAGLLIYTNSKAQVSTSNKTENTQLVSEVRRENNPESPVLDTAHYWTAPEMTSMEMDPQKQTILYGRDLIAHTSLYFGPKGTVYKEGTNGMNCQNCHLDAGTKVFGNNYSAVASTYPKYRARSGAREDMVKRVNDCFERSLNGKPLKASSKEMKAIISYITWLGKDVAKGEKPKGSGFQKLALLDRPADPEKGRLVYTLKCQSCHQANGEGLLNAEGNAYTYPPLWGNHSYNNGAGLYRISNFARFVKYNMPLGVTHTNAQLTDEEAWDVAAFVNSQPRPEKNLKKDWPKIEEKPFDHPFGPYADTFSETQHKYGPYQPIIDKSTTSKKK